MSRLPVTIGFFPLIPAGAREFIGLTRDARCWRRATCWLHARDEVAVVLWNGQHRPV